MSDAKKYEFDLNDPDSWTKMGRPLLPEWIDKETERIGGYVGINRRFKWAWGMSEQVYIESDGNYPSGWYLKYQLGSNERLVGHKYKDKDGQEKIVKDLKDVPKDVLISTPYHVIDQIGTPRWVLEEYRQKGDMGGMYDRNGHYFHRWIVDETQPPNMETQLYPYREPNQSDLDILAGYVQLTAKLTDKDITQGVAKDREREASATAKSKANRIEGMADTLIETVASLPKLPAPPQAVIDRAWRQLEGN